MRSIKFRAWDKYEKKWVDLTKWVIVFCIEGFHLEDIGGNEILSKDVELVEYTGLKDEKGKEIYEGDVVECTDTVWTWYKGYRICIKWPDALTGLESLNKWPQSEIISVLNYFIVIGNIYENPELLKGG